MANLDADILAHEEYRALKAEMLLRIAIQNLAILSAICVFVVCAILGVIHPQDSAIYAFVHSAANLALALQWCHQGVRQCALKQAILKRDEEEGRSNGWEEWLPSQRPNGFLGSRWFVSTKAVFIGLNGVSILLAVPNIGVVFVCACGTIGITTISLLTNPKE